MAESGNELSFTMVAILAASVMSWIGVQLAVGELQIRGGDQVAELEPLDRVPMAVYVHVPTLAERL